MGDLHGHLWLFSLLTNTYFYFYLLGTFYCATFYKVASESAKLERTCKEKHTSTKKGSELKNHSLVRMALFA